MLDATDRALIALLRENARIGHAEAARRLKLSRTTVQARVESLERRGGIVGSKLELSEGITRRVVRGAAAACDHPGRAETFGRRRPRAPAHAGTARAPFGRGCLRSAGGDRGGGRA